MSVACDYFSNSQDNLLIMLEKALRYILIILL